MKQTLHLKALVAAGLVASAVAASAAPVELLPNSLVTPVPQTNTGLDLGTSIFSSTNTFSGKDFDGTVLFTGTLVSTVYRRADNTLAFSYVATNNAGSIDSIERISLSSFNGFTTSVEQGLPSTSTIAASSATRSANGNVVSFGFAPGTATGAIMPGLTSRQAIVFTNATAFDFGSAQFISGGVATAQTNVPSAVPEPASLAVIGVGVAAMIRRRRNRK